MDLPTGGGEARAGRRGNGLSAAAYGVLAHCEPQIADALLRTLAEEGIAAYAVPYEGSVGGYLEVRPPVRFLARVWVDSAELTAARRVLDSRYASAAEPPAVAEDAAWQEIVASLRRSGAHGPTPWPDAENLAPPRASSEHPEPAPRDPDVATVRPATPPGLGGADEVIEPADDLENEHFVPPTPPPVPVPTGPSAYGIAALVAGSLVLLVSTMTEDQVSPALLVLAIAAIVGGFATLVMRMREGPATDSDPDDGAVL